MAAKKRPAHYDQPHAIGRILDIETGKTVRFSVAKIRDDGSIRFRYDPTIETAELVHKFDTYLDAQSLRCRLARDAGLTTAVRSGANLPKFLPFMPTSPVDRRDEFLGLEPEEQAEMLYSLTVMTGRPRARIAAYFMLDPEDLDHIDVKYTEAAIAELEMRIAKKSIFTALGNEAPANTFTMFLSKVFNRWTELGIDVPPPGTAPVDTEPAKSVFENLEVVETHRDKDGTTLAPPTVTPLRLVST